MEAGASLPAFSWQSPVPQWHSRSSELRHSRGEEELIQWTLQTTMQLGLITWLVLLWFVRRWETACCSRALQRWRQPDRQPEDESSEPTSEPEEEAEAAASADELPAEVATPPIAAPARARPPQDLRPPAPEPEPLDGDAAATPPDLNTDPAAETPQTTTGSASAPGTTAQPRGDVLRTHAPHTSPLQELRWASFGTPEGPEGRYHRESLPQLLG